MILFIAGWITGYIVLAIVIALGVNHCVDEQEKTKDILTEGDLHNHYNTK